VSLVAKGLGCVIVGFASVRFGIFGIAALSTVALAAAMFQFYQATPEGPGLALRWGLVQLLYALLTIMPLYVTAQTVPRTSGTLRVGRGVMRSEIPLSGRR